ncbi:hypothetical protein HON22_03840 [Candidatus Peregrinibacteria bacterium]|jgi:hypothetical protein|nr:hypothetical protein [Candidatus Peregrinibacteria bacterium]
MNLQRSTDQGFDKINLRAKADTIYGKMPEVTQIPLDSINQALQNTLKIIHEHHEQFSILIFPNKDTQRLDYIFSEMRPGDKIVAINQKNIGLILLGTINCESIHKIHRRLKSNHAIMCTNNLKAEIVLLQSEEYEAEKEKGCNTLIQKIIKNIEQKINH